MAKAALVSLFTRSWHKRGQQPPYAVAAGIGLALLLIPLYFVSASVLNQLGIKWLFVPIEYLLSRPTHATVFHVVSPIVLLGTLTASILLNLIVLVSTSSEPSPSGAVRIVELRLRFWNLVTVAISLMLIGLLLGYAFVENFVVRTRM